MTTKIQPFVRGQSPTLLDAERANQIVRAVNGLMQSKGTNGIKVVVEGDGRLVISRERGEAIEFNGSVLICINGTPYYINIPYDSERGPYAITDGADFPIGEPE